MSDSGHKSLHLSIIQTHFIARSAKLAGVWGWLLLIKSVSSNKAENTLILTKGCTDCTPEQHESRVIKLGGNTTTELQLFSDTSSNLVSYYSEMPRVPETLQIGTEEAEIQCKSCSVGRLHIYLGKHLSQMTVQSNQREPARRTQKVWYNTLRGQCGQSCIHMIPSPPLSLISSAEHTGNAGKHLSRVQLQNGKFPLNKSTLHSLHALKPVEPDDFRTMKHKKSRTT